MIWLSTVVIAVAITERPHSTLSPPVAVILFALFVAIVAVINELVVRTCTV